MINGRNNRSAVQWILSHREVEAVRSFEALVNHLQDYTYVTIQKTHVFVLTAVRISDLSVKEVANN